MTTRAERERETYNSGIAREQYDRVLRHSKAHSGFAETVESVVSAYHDKVVLELGCSAWKAWLERNKVYPATVHAINISERELDKGRQRATETVIQPEFHLMDAHQLDFPDDSFDLVFGRAILHHLDLTIALAEMKRVLRKNGRIVFSEPLDINPIGKAVRYLTPRARTVDEQPFRFKELAILRKYFDIDLYPTQFLSVPAGVMSGFLFDDSNNVLTRTASQVDKLLVRLLPPAKYWYRRVLIVGKTV